jgi:hypothetical protein
MGETSRLRRLRSQVRRFGVLGGSPGSDCRKLRQQAARTIGRLIQVCELAPQVIADADVASELSGDLAAEVFLVRGQVMMKQGMTGEVATMAGRLASIDASNAGNAYDAACLYSLASAAVTADEERPAGERKKLNDNYAGRAITELRRAEGLNFFDNRSNLVHLGKDKDLDPLRSRDDFKAWLNGLKTTSHEDAADPE